MTDPDDLLHFTPVPGRRRARGWSADAQHAFIEALSRCGVVAQAARSVGCSPRSAYLLRERPGAESFAAAWDWAMEMGLDESRARAMELIQGREELPIVRHGRIVGKRIRSNHRVMLAALRALDAERNGLRETMAHRERIARRDLIQRLYEPWPSDPLPPASSLAASHGTASHHGAPPPDAAPPQAPYHGHAPASGDAPAPAMPDRGVAPPPPPGPRARLL